jgi:hypothetical protein
MDIIIGDRVAHVYKRQEAIVVDAYPQFFNGVELREGEAGVIVEFDDGVRQWWHKDNVVVI